MWGEGGGRGPLRVPAPSPACRLQQGGRGGLRSCRPAAQGPGCAQLPSPALSVQFAPWNGAGIFVPVTVRALAVPCAVCSLYVKWCSPPPGPHAPCCKEGTTSEPRGPPMTPGTGACRSAGSQPLPILAGMHFDLFSLCAPLPHSLGPPDWRSLSLEDLLTV